MRILVDVSAGRIIAEVLRALGYDTSFVSDVNPRMPDGEILAWAVAEQRYLVTADKDFGELVFHSGQSHAGVLLLRLPKSRRAEKIVVITAILSQHAPQLPNRFAVYQRGRLRIH